MKCIGCPKPVDSALIETEYCVATENCGIFVYRAVTQLDVFYQATRFD